MKMEVTELGPMKRALKIEVPADEVTQRFARAYVELNRQVNIPGFRPGKVPLALLEKRYAKTVEEDVIRSLVPDFYDKAVRRLNAAELDVFIGQDFLITLPNVELLPVTYLFRRCEDDPELRRELFRGSGYLLYHVLDDLFDYCFPILDKIGHKLDRIEDELFEGASQEVVRDISNVKQEIISYRKIIKPERATLRLLERRVERFLPEELEIYFDDIVDASERIWDLLDNYKEVADALEQTNESVISHRQNDVLRLLTLISVTMLPLTLITGIFGMNVLYPGEGTPEAFWIIIALLVATLAGMVAFFRYKRWL